MKPRAPRKTAKTTKISRTPRTARAAGRTKPSLRLLRVIVAALDAKKAEDLRVLDVSKQSSVTDYLVLATGNSEPHLRSLRIELERVLDLEQVRVLGVDASKGSGWTVVDAFDIMVHLFSPENRSKYRLELLWRDATELSPAGIPD